MAQTLHQHFNIFKMIFTAGFLLFSVTQIQAAEVVNETSSVVGTYTVLSDGQVTINIKGADGGDAATKGGEGASVTGTFTVTAGQVIGYVIGESGKAGTSGSAGGGGSTGVYIDSTLVMVAGAGAGGDNSGGAIGLGGNTGSDGDDGTGTGFGAGGTSGNGGGAGGGGNDSGGGGGINSPGADGDANSLGGGQATGSITFALGGTGDNGSDGGQGLTGGGGADTGSYSGGAGGYSGGGGAGNSGSAGGGGSYINTGYAGYISGNFTAGGDGTGNENDGSIVIDVFTDVELEPILSITKDSNISGDIKPGEIFTYTIVVENDAASLSAATNVTVRDPLPAGVTYVAASAQKTYPDATTVTYTSPSFGTVNVGGTGSETLTFDTTGILPADATLTQYSYSTNGESLDPSWRSEIHLTATYPTGTAYDDIDFGGAPHNLPESSGTYSVSQGPTPVFGTAVGIYSFTWTEDYDDAGINNAVAAASFTIDYVVPSYTTDSAYDPSPIPAPSFVVTAADNITLNPGETLTVTFQVKADDDLSSIDEIINTAYAASTEITTEISASASNTVLPVTIAYVHPDRYGDTLEVDFGTATETANLGFNIYGIKGKGKRAKWIKLNEELIPGALDSFEPQEYTASLSILEGMKFKKIGIAGVDVSGKEDRHGPFKVGKAHGEKAVIVPVDWIKVQTEVKQDRKARKAKKRAKRQARKAQRKETRGIFKEDAVTLKVKEKAVYKVTHDDLMGKNIDLRGFKASKIAISLKDEGIARYISGLNKRAKWTKNSAIEFIGEAPNGTDALYVKSNHYRVTLNKQLVVEKEEIEPLTTKEMVIEHNNKYSYTLMSDDPFYEAFFYTLNENATGKYTSKFNMPEVIPSGMSRLFIQTVVNTKGSHNMSVELNGENIAEATAQGAGTWPIEATVDNSIFKENGNELTFTLYGENDGLDIVVYDKLIINYDEGEEVNSQTPDIEINNRVTKKELRVKRGINYLIISHPLFINETLDRYIQVRQGEGWNIEVVNVEDIYAAYANGMAIPEAIQDYLKDATQSDVTHVQLIGAASYDYHDYLGTGSMSFIPSIYTLTNKYVKHTPCDTCYVMGEDELPTVAIGRWPVRTLEDFENVIDKTLEWKNSGNSSGASVLLISDETDDKGKNFDSQMKRLEDKIYAKGYNTQKVYMDELNEEYGDDAVSIARGRIKEHMEQGVSIVSYNGHGASSKWSFKGLLKQEDISTIENTSLTPIALAFTCAASYADSPYMSTMAHQLITADKNGAVAVYGSSTYSKYRDNGLIIGKVFDGLTKGVTLGESIKNKKHSLGAVYSDIVKSSNLIGDATLKLD